MLSFRRLPTFGVANNYYVSTKNTTEVNYFDIVAFGKLAETVSKYLIKGKQVLTPQAAEH